MYSPRSNGRQGSDHSSFPNFQRKPSQQSNFSRKLASQIVDQRVRNYNQLQTFYMPYLKKAFQDNKFNNSSLRSPQQLIFSSRLLEMRESESKRRLDFLQIENDRKDKKINQLNEKLISFIERLKMYEPNVGIDADIPVNSIEESEKKIKKLESLLKIRNEETFFRLKLKAMNLLEEFELTKEDTEGINQIDSEHGVFEYMINKLKIKIKDYKQKSRYIQEESEKGKRSTDQLQDELRKLQQTNQMLRNNERKLKQRQQDIKKQWTASNQKLIQREKQVQTMDVQIFRLKRHLQQKDGMLLKSTSQTFTKTARADDLKKQFQTQVKDQRQIITALTIDVNDLKQQLQFITGELEQYKIRDKFKSQEQQKTYREFIRWKERCEWYEKEREGKVNYYEEKNKVLEIEVEKLKNEVAEVQSVDVMNSSHNADLRNNYDHLHIELQYKNEQIRFLQDKCRRLQQQNRIRQHETNESSKYMMQDYGKRKDQEWERRLRDKDNELKRKVDDIKQIYEQRLTVKQRKHQEQIESMQGEIKKIEIESPTILPFIQKKSEYIASKVSIEGSRNYLQYDRI